MLSHTGMTVRYSAITTFSQAVLSHTGMAGEMRCTKEPEKAMPGFLQRGHRRFRAPVCDRRGAGKDRRGMESTVTSARTAGVFTPRGAKEKTRRGADARRRRSRTRSKDEARCGKSQRNGVVPLFRAKSLALSRTAARSGTGRDAITRRGGLGRRGRGSPRRRTRGRCRREGRWPDGKRSHRGAQGSRPGSRWWHRLRCPGPRRGSPP